MKAARTANYINWLPAKRIVRGPGLILSDVSAAKGEARLTLGTSCWWPGNLTLLLRRFYNPYCIMMPVWGFVAGAKQIPQFNIQ